MNKRIQQLVGQAGFHPNLNWDHTDWHASGHSNLFEKFAELIVKECVNITDDLVNRNADGTWASNELYTDYNGALFEVKRRMQETFGIDT